MNRFSFLLATLTTLFITSISAQITPKAKKPWPAMPNSPNYYEVRQAYLDHVANEEMETELLGLEAEDDDVYAKFNRWDYLMKTRVDANGNYPDPRTAFLEWEAYKKSHAEAYEGQRAAGWEPVGNAEVPTDGGGVGRVNVIIQDPIDAGVLYVGTAGGGLWKSPDGGTTWLPLTDNIPVTSIADVVVDYTNNDIIYVVSGDGYGYEASWQADNDFWGGVYSAGILKSTDGGVTWLPTGLSYNQDELMIVQRLVMNPADPNILVAATREGMFRSTDGGDTWTLVSSVHCYDFAQHVTDSDILYAVGDRDVMRSTNAGASWTVLKNNLAGTDDRMSIETSNDNPDKIYVLSYGGQMDISDNGGTTWSSMSSPSGATSFYNYYDLVLDVSNVDENLIFAGGLEIARSTNGGTSWSKKSVWDDWTASNYVHADSKGLLCDPNDVNIVYATNDGGVFKSTDKGQTWTDISAGLRVAQPYRLSPAYTVTDMVLNGWQDNGCNLWDGTTWKRVQGGDGMDVIIDYSNEDRMYASFQYGYVNRTTNGGISWTPLPVAGGGWLTPYEMDPVDHMIMYYGASTGTIQKSLNGGTSWSNLSSNLGGEVFDIAIAPSNTNYVYACALQTMKVSTNAGTTWTNITSGLPTAGTGFNYIAVSDEDPTHVWVAISGYEDGKKVYFSDNAGSTWTNVSGTLPNVPVNCIVYENVSDDDRVYIGTDIGVFTRTNATDWEPYMTGLPNVMVHELEIDYAEYKIYAATYGRSTWKSDLYDFVAPTLNVGVVDLQYCPGQDVDVPYVGTGTFAAGNVFTAELSNATGSFTTPTAIGTFASTDLAGNIPSVIPTTASGAGYRIRVKSSSPGLTSTDNGANILIDCEQPVDVATDVVTPTTATLDWADVYCAIEYEVRYKSSIDVDYTYVTTTSSTYTLTDLNPSTPYEWAVRTICLASPDVSTDFTSSEDFTTGQNAITDLIGVSGIFLYPNPASDNCALQLNTANAMDMRIELFDVTGQSVVILQNGTIAAGDHSIALDLAHIAAGAYTLKISANGKSAALQLIKE